MHVCMQIYSLWLAFSNQVHPRYTHQPLSMWSHLMTTKSVERASSALSSTDGVGVQLYICTYAAQPGTNSQTDEFNLFMDSSQIICKNMGIKKEIATLHLDPLLNAFHVNKVYQHTCMDAHVWIVKWF